MLVQKESRSECPNGLCQNVMLCLNFILHSGGVLRVVLDNVHHARRGDGQDEDGAAVATRFSELRSENQVFALNAVKGDALQCTLLAVVGRKEIKKGFLGETAAEHGRIVAANVNLNVVVKTGVAGIVGQRGQGAVGFATNVDVVFVACYVFFRLEAPGSVCPVGNGSLGCGSSGSGVDGGGRCLFGLVAATCQQRQGKHENERCLFHDFKVVAVFCLSR